MHFGLNLFDVMIVLLLQQRQKSSLFPPGCGRSRRFEYSGSVICYRRWRCSRNFFGRRRCLFNSYFLPFFHGSFKGLLVTLRILTLWLCWLRSLVVIEFFLILIQQPSELTGHWLLDRLFVLCFVILAISFWPFLVRFCLTINANKKRSSSGWWSSS